MIEPRAPHGRELSNQDDGLNETDTFDLEGCAKLNLDLYLDSQADIQTPSGG